MHGAPPQPLGWIGILQQGIGDYEDRETGVPQGVEPHRALEPGAEQAPWREHARKGQHPRDDDERSEEISTCDHEERTRTQDGELGKQQDSGDQIVHEHRRGISRDEGVDPRQLNPREGPCRDEKYDKQNQHNAKREPLLRWARRQVREDKGLFLRGGGRLHHRGDSSQRLERAARSSYRFATLVTCCLSSRPVLSIGTADDGQGSVAASAQAGLARFPPAAHVFAPATDLRTLFRSIVPALPGPIGHPA